MPRIVAHLGRTATVMALILVVAFLLAASSLPTQAGTTTPSAFFTCTPAAVGTFANRVHVRCSPAAPSNISYFAVCSASDPTGASRFLSVFTTAYALGKRLGIYYTPTDTSGTACGCASADCRMLWGAEVVP